MALLKLTEAELRFVLETLDGAREEFEELVKTEDWYVTEMDERCLAAYNIMKYAEKQEERN
jgi:hypothetical protein